MKAMTWQLATLCCVKVHSKYIKKRRSESAHLGQGRTIPRVSGTPAYNVTTPQPVGTELE